MVSDYLQIRHTLYFRYNLFFSLPPASPSSSSSLSKRASLQAIAIGLASLFLALVILIPTFVIGTPLRGQTLQHGILLALFAVFVISGFNFLALIQYIPQVRLTYSLKEAGSLSMASLALQMLVYMLLAASLAQRFTSTSGQVPLMSSFTAFFFLGGSLVLQYTLTAMFSGLLLGMSFYCDQVSPDERRDDASSRDEQTSLLGESD